MIGRRRAHCYKGEWRELARWFLARTNPQKDVIHAWEDAVGRFVGVPCAKATGSGRSGLRRILEYYRLSRGDEVIIPAYTLAELIPFIEATGAKARPADIDTASLNVTAATIEARITPNTKLILILHAFGSPCNMPPIIELSSRTGIPVVEDCAHALGACLNEKKAGSFGAASFFSFETTKPVNTYGGGMVVTGDPSLAAFLAQEEAPAQVRAMPVAKKLGAVAMERMMFATGLATFPLWLLANPATKSKMERLYRSVQHGVPPTVGYAPMQAQIGLNKLKTLPQRISGRDSLVQRMKTLIHQEVTIQRPEDGAVSTWYFLVALLPGDASVVRSRLLRRGIDAGIGSEIADNCARVLGRDDCPNMDSVFPRAIALPIYDGMKDSQIERVALLLNRSL